MKQLKSRNQRLQSLTLDIRESKLNITKAGEKGSKEKPFTVNLDGMIAESRRFDSLHLLTEHTFMTVKE